jgi:hypothetical protein
MSAATQTPPGQHVFEFGAMPKPPQPCVEDCWHEPIGPIPAQIPPPTLAGQFEFAA